MSKTKTYMANEIEVGYHPDGCRIDKTASPINYYTKWKIRLGGKWVNPKPVCFFSLPEAGWIKIEKFNWDDIT